MLDFAKSKARRVAAVAAVLALTGCSPAGPQPPPTRPPHAPLAAGPGSAVAAPAPSASPPASASSLPPSSAPSPYRVATIRDTPLRVGELSLAPGSRLGVLGGVPVEVRANSLELRRDLMAGLVKNLPGMARLTSIGGRWPDAAFVAADNTFNGDVFAWRAKRWQPRAPAALRADSGGYLERWRIGRWWKGRVLALHSTMGTHEWVLLSGRPGAMPTFEGKRVGCRVAVQDAVWDDTGRIVAVGQSCPETEDAKLVAKHWASGAASATVLPLPGSPEELWLAALGSSEVFAVGTERVGRDTLAYLARFDGERWSRAPLPVDFRLTDLRVAAHAPGDGALYLTTVGALWRRDAAGGWTRVPLPPAPELTKQTPRIRVAAGSPYWIDGMWQLGSAMWLSGQVPFTRLSAAGHLILHASDVQLPSEDDVAAAQKAYLPESWRQ
jgi:hypothetical protein